MFVERMLHSRAGKELEAMQPTLDLQQESSCRLQTLKPASTLHITGRLVLPSQSGCMLDGKGTERSLPAKGQDIPVSEMARSWISLLLLCIVASQVDGRGVYFVQDENNSMIGLNK